MRLLIVDDDEISRLMLHEALAKAGYDVETAANGRDAMSRIRSAGCRLIISDWEMPEMNGVELCRAIRQSDLPGYTYVILLTSRDDSAGRVEGLNAGADDFVAKPYDLPELLARIRTGERVLSLETRDVAIFAMARLAESRDPETGAHLERVRNYSRALAQDLATSSRYADQINPEFIRLIYQTSPLHDIGKVGIPDSVLLKAGRLSDREFEIMKMHAMIGADTLAAALKEFPGIKFLEMGRDIAAAHHERFDGSGYPAGLVGETIPLCARIVAVADVYDALTSKRVYKSAFSHDIARAMILADSGAHFDPVLVESFVRIERQLIKIRDHFADARAAA
jgi:putative two-component system response regulator